MKIKIVILVVLVCSTAQASFKITEKFLDALEHVESGRNPKAIGDSGRAVGSMQLWKIYVREANRILQYPVFSPGDRTDPLASREMVRVTISYWAAYHERRGVRITPSILASLHRMPNHKWSPKRMKSKLERGRTAKLLRHMGKK